ASRDIGPAPTGGVRQGRVGQVLGLPYPHVAVIPLDDAVAIDIDGEEFDAQPGYVRAGGRRDPVVVTTCRVTIRGELLHQCNLGRSGPLDRLDTRLQSLGEVA